MDKNTLRNAAAFLTVLVTGMLIVLIGIEVYLHFSGLSMMYLERFLALPIFGAFFVCIPEVEKKAKKLFGCEPE